MNTALATTHIHKNLVRHPKNGKEPWEGLPLGDLEDFTKSVKAHLGEVSNLSGTTLGMGNYGEILDHLRQMSGWKEPVRFEVVRPKKQYIVRDNTTGKDIIRRAASSAAQYYADALNSGEMAVNEQGKLLVTTPRPKAVPARKTVVAPKVIADQIRAREALRNVHVEEKTPRRKKAVVSVSVSVPPVEAQVTVVLPKRKRADVPANWTAMTKEADTPSAREWWLQYIERWIRGEV